MLTWPVSYQYVMISGHKTESHDTSWLRFWMSPKSLASTEGNEGREESHSWEKEFEPDSIWEKTAFGSPAKGLPAAWLRIHSGVGKRIWGTLHNFQRQRKDIDKPACTRHAPC